MTLTFNQGKSGFIRMVTEPTKSVQVLSYDCLKKGNVLYVWDLIVLPHWFEMKSCRMS